jgi:hypothetical protein
MKAIMACVGGRTPAHRPAGECRHSPGGRAKYALALRRISSAWRSSRFSRSNALSLAGHVAGQAGLSAVALRLLHHPFSVCAVQPILPATDTTAAQRPMPGLVIQHQPHRSVTDLRRKPVRCLARHRSTFSGGGASDKPAAVQLTQRSL